MFSFDSQVFFVNPDGTENLDPRPPFRIRLPRNLKENTHALPGTDQLTVEAYVSPDTGPYPEDQPKQNSIRFTPAQVKLKILNGKQVLS